MAKKKGSRGGKDKGRRGPQRRSGLARQRGVHKAGRARLGDLSRYDEDAPALEDLAASEHNSDSGENVLRRFNRVARTQASAEGAPGTIAGCEGLFYIVRNADGEELSCQIRRVLKKMLTGVKSPLAVGDRVRYCHSPEGDAVITALELRANQIARADSHNKALEHVMAANVDRLVIVAAVLQPELKPGLIDRYLLIAHYNDVEPVVVLNKCDLAAADQTATRYRALGYAVHCTQAVPDHPSVKALRAELAGRTCIFTGQSGVGKSSLINALYPSLDLRVGAVSEALQKGRHTTTTARSHPVPGGGALIDTPGIRECGISGMAPLDVALLYPDIAAHHHACRFTNCLHLHEPDCAVKAAVETGAIDVERYLSYCSIVEEDLADGR